MVLLVPETAMAGSTTLPTAGSTGSAPDYGDRFLPRAPEATLDLGVPHNILVDLMLKMTMMEGNTTLSRLSYAMKVSTPICDAVFHHLRKEQFVEVKGMRGIDYEFSLTASGRKVAQDR